MTVFSGETIRGERVILDEDSYPRGCTLIDCVLVYRGGGELSFDFHTRNCSWSFEGAAANTVRFLQALNLLPANAAQMLVVPNAGMDKNKLQ